MKISKTRSFKVLSMMVLLASIGLTTVPVYADTKAGGNTAASFTISSTSPQTITSTSLTMSTAHTHVCVVNASAQVPAPSTPPGTYGFGLFLDSDSTPATGTVRHVQFIDGSGTDETTETVSTSRAFTGLMGTHTFRFRGYKSITSYGSVNVSNASITVICVGP